MLSLSKGIMVKNKYYRLPLLESSRNCGLRCPGILQNLLIHFGEALPLGVCKGGYHTTSCSPPGASSQQASSAGSGMSGWLIQTEWEYSPWLQLVTERIKIEFLSYSFKCILWTPECSTAVTIHKWAEHKPRFIRRHSPCDQKNDC